MIGFFFPFLTGYSHRNAEVAVLPRELGPRRDGAQAPLARARQQTPVGDLNGKAPRRMFQLKSCLFQGGSRRGRCRGGRRGGSGGACSRRSGCGGAPPKGRAPRTPAYLPGTTLTP